jgi:hypothetical protein
MTRILRTALAALVLLAPLVPASASGTTPASPQRIFHFTDPRVSESSGLVDLGTTVLTINDSGDGPYVYDVDKRTGNTVGVTTYTTDAVVDVEAIARGRNGTIWVGDIGDNSANRGLVSVYALPPVQPGDHTVTARRYDLQYKGGPRDAETLLVDPNSGQLYVVSKGLFSGQVFAAPLHLSSDHPNLLRPVARVGGIVTDGSFTPDGRFVVLRDYSAANLYVPGTWRSPAVMELPRQPQGEGLAMLPSGRQVLVSSEGAHTAVWSVPLSRKMQAAMRDRGAGWHRSGPDPTQSLLDRFSGKDGLLRGITVGAIVLSALGVVWVLFRGVRPRSRSTK